MLYLSRSVFEFYEVFLPLTHLPNCLAMNKIASTHRATDNIDVQTRTLQKFLSSRNRKVKKAVSDITSTVQAAAAHSIQTVRGDRDRISDTTDHLDGILTGELQLSLTEEIKAISDLAHELEEFFDNTVLKQTFPDVFEKMEAKLLHIRKREEQVITKEAELERIIREKVADAERRAKLESTTSKGLFESALQKAEKVIDQNKITRFVCSTISRFQEEFEHIQKTRDVEYVTRLFQDTIEPFQITKVIADKEGKLTKIIINSFTEDCFQDLFFFFYRYYNELMDIYETDGELPAIAVELSRIFMKKKKNAEQIIAEMHTLR